jgi:hypothetical protein
MWVYWFMFLVPALTSISPYRVDRISRFFIIGISALTLMVLIGLRDHVGHDWNNYMKMFYRDESRDLIGAATSVEPAYTLLDWFSSRLGWDVYGVNSVCAAILVSGLFAFCRRQPNFWRTLAMSIPVMVIGIGMGATRQATAIGLLMFAFNAFVDRKLIRYLIFVSLAVLFHRTAAVFFLPAWFIHNRFSILPLVIGGLTFFVISNFFLKDAMSYYTDSYVGADIVASGALPRIAMNVAAAGAFFYFRRRWAELYDDAPFFTLMSGVTILMSLAVFNSPAATDRMSMYLLPIQVAIFSRLPEMFDRTRRTAVTLAVFGLYAAVLFVWLNFSYFATTSWLPYRNLLWS